MTPHDDIRDIDRALTQARKARRDNDQGIAFHTRRAAELLEQDATLAAHIDLLLDQRADAMYRALGG